MPAKKKSYAQLIKQIEILQKEAEDIRRSEVNGVVARIREAMAHYGLTAADLGLTPAPASAPRKAAAKAPFKTRKAGKTTKAGKAAPVVKFRDEAGNVWVGRGKRPQWIRDALAAGKSLKDFAV